MALLDEKNLAAEAAKRARYRVRHVGTKLNEAEVRELEALAAKRKQTHAELIRELILADVERDKAGAQPSPEMNKATAFRLLVTYALRPVATSETMTEKAFDDLVAEIKQRKVRVAKP
jgi:predicted polyphosphate/ATP-dependent NAD kinase